MSVHLLSSLFWAPQMTLFMKHVSYITEQVLVWPCRTTLVSERTVSCHVKSSFQVTLCRTRSSASEEVLGGRSSQLGLRPLRHTEGGQSGDHPLVKGLLRTAPGTRGPYRVQTVTAKELFSFSLLIAHFLWRSSQCSGTARVTRRQRGLCAGDACPREDQSVGRWPCVCSSHQLGPVHGGKKWMRFDIFHPSNSSTKTFHGVELQELKKRI